MAKKPNRDQSSDPDDQVDSEKPALTPEEAEEIFLDQYARLLWETYWYKKRRGDYDKKTQA